MRWKPYRRYFDLFRNFIGGELIDDFEDGGPGALYGKKPGTQTYVIPANWGWCYECPGCGIDPLNWNGSTPPTRWWSNNNFCPAPIPPYPSCFAVGNSHGTLPVAPGVPQKQIYFELDFRGGGVMGYPVVRTYVYTGAGNPPAYPNYVPLVKVPLPVPFLAPPVPWIDPLDDGYPEVEPVAQPEVRPWQRPAVEYKVRERPDGGGALLPPRGGGPRGGVKPPKGGGTPVVVDQLPPSVRKKEHKRRIPPWAGVAVGAVTEMVDFLECVEKAEGRRLRGGYHGPNIPYHRKLADRIAGAAEHLDELDFAELADCMRRQGANDFVIGKANRMVNDALRAARKSGYYPRTARGYGSGPHDAGHWGTRF